MSSSGLAGNFEARAKSGKGKASVNPHHLVVEQRAISLVKEHASLLQETLHSAKYREILRHSQKQFLEVDRIVAKTEDQTIKIHKLLRRIEKQEDRICTALSTVPVRDTNFPCFLVKWAFVSLTSIWSKISNLVGKISFNQADFDDKIRAVFTPLSDHPSKRCGRPFAF